MENRSSPLHPSYLELNDRGRLLPRVDKARYLLSSCMLCPHKCGVNRLEGERGFCATGSRARIASYGPHFGEEAPISGIHGSGTIFFGGCNMKCRFCQNYDISQGQKGMEVDGSELAEIMLALQKKGCHNINLVTPSHVVPQILEALYLAVSDGLAIPIVFNTGGYDSLDTLSLLDEVIDIYMPDMKYASPAHGMKYSGIQNYPHFNRIAVREMYRQVGGLVLDEHGIARRGLLVRHLVLPSGISGGREIFRFLALEISPDTFINIMDQYFPCYRADEFPEINRRILRKEYRKSVDEAQREGLERIFQG
ncbi:MAG: 4Fe-4S cluster-binding domain-containing protein [Synergistales bacterium]|nr:4Fe-4S cluster-binding domain-containing protein [Synergistales bacterium]